jgi:hypothetical protein
LGDAEKASEAPLGTPRAVKLKERGVDLTFLLITFKGESCFREVGSTAAAKEARDSLGV